MCRQIADFLPLVFCIQLDTITHGHKTTEIFDTWLAELRDRNAAAVVTARIIRVANGLLGDVKSLGNSVSELRINIGPGYRVYFTRKGNELIILLCGGDKSTQDKDIKIARQLAKNL